MDRPDLITFWRCSYVLTEWEGFNEEGQDADRVSTVSVLFPAKRGVAACIILLLLLGKLKPEEGPG